VHRSRPGSARGTLLKNTAMLALLQLSTYVLSLITVPYQTRVLGPEAYGLLGVATAVMVYFQLVIDFGFLLSATEDVSAHREDLSHLRRLMTCVTLCKLVLTLVSALALWVLCRVITPWTGKTRLFFLFFLSTVCTSLLPDYLYRGIERMTAVTLRTVAVRGFFTVMIFLLLRSPEDLWLVPLLNFLGNGAAMALSYWDLSRRFSLRFCRVSLKDVFTVFRRSSVFFLSRFATTAYTAMNTILLDLITRQGAVTGYYTAADKLLTTGKNLLSPISDSLYPYMTRHRDFRLVKKILLLVVPLIALFCVGCFIWAEPLCRLLLGEEYGPAGTVLRRLLPVAVMTLPNYILGFPTLSAMGLSKYANYSVMFASALHILLLGVLYFTGNITMLSLAGLVSVTEAVVLLFRILVILCHRDRLRPGEVSHV